MGTITFITKNQTKKTLFIDNAKKLLSISNKFVNSTFTSTHIHKKKLPKFTAAIKVKSYFYFRWSSKYLVTVLIK